MPRGDKSKYTDKQERKADHIAESYEAGGVPEKEAERRAWAHALPREGTAWAARQALYMTLVAACDGRCVGFLELDVSGGRIETLYIWPSLAGRGIGTTLLIHAERILLEHGVSQVEIEASRMLLERLQRRGYDNLGEQWVERSGEMLQRYRLVKQLSAVET